MSGLAHLLLKKKYVVTGSDIAFNPLIEKLIQDGATIFKGQAAENVPNQTTVIYSSDIKTDNPEYLSAVEKQCRLLHRSDLLAELMEGQTSLAVTGTHGKTTTSALLATVMVEAGMDPSYSVGGMLSSYHANARLGQGQFFVLEADESDRSFLRYSPFGAIITNIDRDHLNNYEDSEEKLIHSFAQFISQVESKNHLFWCGDDIHLKALNPQGQSYGFNDGNDWQILNFRQEGFKIIFDIKTDTELFKAIEVPLTGKHQALNATAVFGLATELGIDENRIRQGFLSFHGVKRRCEMKGEFHGVQFFDDYGHHPTEIKATLLALRQAIQDHRFIVVFQAHRYSRTKDCLGSFGTIFDVADELIVTDIYGSGEKAISGVSHEQIIQEVKTQSTIPVQYISRPAIGHFLAKFVRPHDVVLTIGAGDVTKISQETLAILEKQTPRKLKVGLVFGGSKTEHEISIRSANHFRDSLINPLYEVEEFGITKEGSWITGPDTKARLEQLLEKKSTTSPRPLSNEVIDKLLECDVLIPVLHGPLGEDGTIQGFFEILGKPYVGCDHRGSAIAMDKVICKKLALFHDLPTSPFIEIKSNQWRDNPQKFLDTIKKQLSFPLFVKPIHLGSTVGVKKVEQFDQLSQAIDTAFLYDTHILVENGIKGRELEFAVLGNQQVTTFPPGEIITKGQVYDYQGKYSVQSMPTTPKAEISKKLADEGMALAKKAYEITGCTGLARVDFFLDEQGKYWFNEVNPMPGFTHLSLYPQICAANGLSGNQLMEHFIRLALERYRAQKRMVEL